MKITDENVKRLKQEHHDKLKQDMEKANTSVQDKKPYYPEYWKKRKKRLSPDFVKMLNETAKREFDTVDEYGMYKQGVFLHGACVVTVSRENGLWGLHIISEMPIMLPLITEIRYKFLPDDLVMAMLFGTRAESKELKGVVLYEVPNNAKDEEE